MKLLPIVAETALVRFLLGVSTHVFLQNLGLVALVITDNAHVGSLLRVCADVLLEVAAPRTGKAAIAAGERLLAGVCAHVVAQVPSMHSLQESIDYCQKHLQNHVYSKSHLDKLIYKATLNV